MSGPTDPAEGHFDKGLWGFDGTVWRKLQLLFGYHSIYRELVTVAHVGDGTYWHKLTAVPANELWVINSIVTAANKAAAGMCALSVYEGASFYHVKAVPSLAANTSLDVTGSFVLSVGMQVACYYNTLAANATVNLYALGYKMKLNL